MSITAADTCHENVKYHDLETLGASYEIPPLAHTCQISGQTYFTRYRYHCEDRLAYPVFFDPKSDILFMSDIPALTPEQVCSKALDARVQNLAVGGDWNRVQTKVMHFLHYFSSLENFIFVKYTGNYDASSVQSTLKYYHQFMKEYRRWQISDLMDTKMTPADIHERWKLPEAVLGIPILNQNRNRDRNMKIFYSESAIMNKVGE